MRSSKQTRKSIWVVVVLLAHVAVMTSGLAVFMWLRSLPPSLPDGFEDDRSFDVDEESTDTLPAGFSHYPPPGKIPYSSKSLRYAIKVLESLHTRPGPIQLGDWLASFSEDGQTFEQYLAEKTIHSTRTRNRIYVQPLGRFTDEQARIVKLAAEYLGVYFNLQTVLLAEKDTDFIPAKARRNNYQGEQLLTSYITHEFLRPNLPPDAVCTIAFTSSDLWPGDGWNFVFGEASLRGRVGVWSLSRFGDPAESDESFHKCLTRTLKVATHETGHLFTIEHCIAWNCNMRGCNSLYESDRYPMWLCPECMAKVCYSTRSDPVNRYLRLAEFCARIGLKEEVMMFERSADALVEAGYPWNPNQRTLDGD